MSHRMRNIALGCGLTGAVGAAALVVGWLVLRQWMGLPILGAPPTDPDTRILVMLERPPQGASYPVGAPIPVSAQAISEVPLRSLELQVNGETFAATTIGDGPAAGTNLALGAQVSTSQAELESPGSMAVDGDPETHWSAGEFAPQWIEVDLGSPQSIAGVRLIPSQFPAGPTTHRLLGKLSPGGAYLLLHTFSGPTEDLVPLEVTPSVPWEGLRFLRLETTESPSWVAWHEIEVIAGEPSSAPQAVWYWAAEAPGEYFLQARAVDRDGKVNVSNIARVTALEAASGIIMQMPTAQAGDTLAAISDRMGIPLGDIQAYSSRDPQEPLSEGETVLIPAAPLPPAGAGSPPPPVPRFENGVLILGKPVEVAYLYLRYEGGAWQRIPDGWELVPVETGGVPFQDLLPDRFKPFEYEAWGWSGGSLIYLGYGTSPGAVVEGGVMSLLPVDVTRLAVKSPWVNQETLQTEDRFFEEKVIYWDMTPQQLDLEFRWDTLTEAKQGIWQVLSAPSFSPEMMNPPGLIATGKVGAGDEFFSIDFSKFVHPPPGTGGPGGSPAQPPAANPTTGDLASQGLSLGTGESAVYLPVPPLMEAYYVRIVPVTNNQVVGFPSNLVTVRYEPPPPPVQIASPSQPLFEARIVDFEPGAFPDPNLWGCVQIIKNDPNYPFGPLTTYEVGEVVCPEPHAGGNPASVWDIFEFIVDAWNWVSEAFNDLKNLVVNLALSVLPCSELGLEGACKAVLRTALEIGLASLGVPPSLPNFDQIVEAGKGHIVDLAVQAALDFSPVPCVGPCEDELRKSIGGAIDALAEEAANMSVEPACGNEKIAHEHGKEPLCIIGYIVKPAPGSIYENPVAIVEITRLAGVEPPVPVSAGPVCRLKVTIHGTNMFPGGNVFGPYGTNTSMQVPTQEIDGLLFESNASPLLDMPPGATEQVAVGLIPTNGDLLFPWTQELWKFSQIAPKKHFGLTKDWFTLYRGSTAEVTVRGYFSTDVYSSCVNPLNTWEEVLP